MKLEEELQRKQRKELDELEDFTLLQNVAKSRKSKEKHLFVESSLSTDEYAFEMRRIQEESGKPKSACKISSLFSKKTVFT